MTATRYAIGPNTMPLPSAPCPCHSGRTYKKCCQPFHQGDAAPTPEALMRSRYAAYAVGKVDYIRATTDPNGPQWEPDEERWNASIRHFSRNTRFVGLQILDHQEDGDRGMVRFYARLSHAGQDASFGEESQFVRRDGRWLYHSGARATPPPSAPGPRR